MRERVAKAPAPAMAKASDARGAQPKAPVQVSALPSTSPGGVLDRMVARGSLEDASAATTTGEAKALPWRSRLEDGFGASLVRVPPGAVGGNLLGPEGAADPAEEARAHAAQSSVAASREGSEQLSRLMADRLPSGPVSKEVIQALEPHTGRLPSDLRLHTGPEADRVLAGHRARGLAKANEIWVGGESLAPTPGDFATIFVHEAAHVASGGSLAQSPPRFGHEEVPDTGWYSRPGQEEVPSQDESSDAGDRRFFADLRGLRKNLWVKKDSNFVLAGEVR